MGGTIVEIDLNFTPNNVEKGIKIFAKLSQKRSKQQSSKAVEGPETKPVIALPRKMQKNPRKFAQLRDRCEKVTKVWKSYEKPGKARKSVEKFGKLRKSSMEKFGKVFGKVRNNFEKLGTVWKSLKKFGKVWKSLEKFGKVWKSLKTVIP